jgi:hypothetical protein
MPTNRFLVIAPVNYRVLTVLMACAAGLILCPTAHAQEWGGEFQLIASDGAAQDSFGGSVSISGDTAIVGAFEDAAPVALSGSAYVFVRSGPAGKPVWTEQQKLTASDAQAGDEFGWSVAISGDTAIVGAYLDDPPDGSVTNNHGSAYVFVRSGPSGQEVWTQQAKLIASDGAAGDNFGWAVSISGDTAIVGALGDDAPGANGSGSAYVFVRSGAIWTQQQKLTASDGAINDGFGYSVSISGDTAIVGAFHDDAPASDSGSAYVFVRSGTVWTQQPRFTASDGAANDQFGISVSISGESAIVGAVSDASGTGSAYVFVRSGGVWTQQQKLTASDGEIGHHFGNAVSLSGESAIVGAENGETLTVGNSGAAYVFVRSGGVWQEQQKITASDGETNDHFGNSVSISGGSAIVGAVVDDTPAGSESGSAYCYSLLALSPGDVNGDGEVDVDDLVAVILGWGTCADCAACDADVNSDCTVDVDDLIVVILNWG